MNIFISLCRLIFISVISLILPLFSFLSNAEECSAIFPTGMQNHQENGGIKFGYNAQLLNSPTNILYTNNLSEDNRSNLLTCNTAQCIAGNEIVSSIDFNDFGNSNVDATVPQNETRILSPGYYDDVILKYRSTLILAAGDFYLSGDLLLASESNIYISSNGPVRLFVKNDVKLSYRSIINYSGEASQLFLYINGDADFNTETYISGFIYGKNDVELDYRSRVSGAITANNISLEQEAIVEYEIKAPDFGDTCSGPPEIPISCAADDVPSIAFSDNFSSIKTGWSTVDFNRSISNWPGDTISESGNENKLVVFDVNSGVMKINGELTLKGDNEYGMVKYELTNENIDKSGTTHYAFSADFSANKVNTNNDLGLTFGYVDDSNYYLARWTKFGATYVSSPFPGIFRRLELVKVSGGVATTLDYLDNILLGNVDSTAGDLVLDAPFNLEVVVNELGTAVCVNDEALLYSERTKPPLNDIGIETYDNDDGLTIDNVELRCDNCQLLEPIADFHFDSCDYTGVDGDVIDDTGNYSGQSVGGFDVLEAGKIERAANIISANQYIETNIPLEDKFSISTWFKKPNSTSGNSYFILGAMDAGGDLLYLDRNLNYRWGVYNASTGGVTGSYSFNNLDDNWHHLVLNYANGQTSLYIDGVFIETLSRAPSGNLKYIGTSFDDVNSATPQSFRAPIDEFMVFDRPLYQAEIIQIYNHQSANNNFDGSLREETICPTILAEYRFEQVSWNGNNGEVEDETGNFDAVAQNGAFTNNANSAIIGNPGTCRYGSFDGVNDYIELPSSFENLQESFTITAWIKPTNLNSGSRIFIDDEKNTRGFGFSLSDGGSGRLRLYSRGVTPVVVDTPAVINANVWTFVTAVHDADNKIRQIYVNGVAQILNNLTTDSLYVGSWGVDNGPATIGGETDSGETNNRFTGDIDEVRVYTGALSAETINDIYQETHPCDNFIDHFEIGHDGNGITCNAENITIKACANSSCSVTDSTPTDVTLLVNGQANKTVTVMSETATNFSFTTPGIATLGLDYGYQCKNGTSSSCDVEFAETGFIITDIPTQLSGKPSNTGYNQRDLFIQAVTTDDNSGACVGVFPSGGDVPVNLSYTCEAGSTCSNNLVLANNGSNKSLTQTLATHNLRFDAQSSAQFTLTYPDAGQLRLNAQKTLLVEDDEGNAETLEFNSSSNAFVERPFAFALTLSDANAFSEDNNGNAIADGSVFKKAGETFEMIATAVQWASGQDVDADGIPSKNELILINNGYNSTAQHFTNEIIIIEDELVLPQPDGVSGIFTPAIMEFGNASSSQTSESFTYSEVGIIDLLAELSDQDYFGVGNIIGATYNVGRFTPAYFIQTIAAGNEGSLIANHHSSNISCSMLDWAYSGQLTDSKGSIVYGEAPILTIKPYNTEGAPVQNYTGDFAKLIKDFTSNTIQLNAASTTHNNTLPLTSDVSTAGNTGIENKNGVLEYELSYEHHFTYVRDENSKVAPFDGSFEIPITQIRDSDGIELKPSDLSGDYFDNPIFSPALNNTVNIRFGRWVMHNAYGPETGDLSMKHIVEQYSGTEFVINTDESCIIPSISDKQPGDLGDSGLNLYDYRLIELDTNAAIKKAHKNVKTTSKVFEGTLHDFTLYAADPSGPFERGSLQIEYKVPSWFLYDWSNIDSMANGPYTENPRAIATFGLFRGNDRIIYWNESTNN